MNQPSVALLPGNAPPVVCGIGDHAVCLADALRHLSLPVRIYTRALPGVAESDNLRTPAPRLDDAGIAAFMARMIADGVKVLHLQYEADTFENNGFALLRFAVAARKARMSLVTTFHALDGPRPWKQAHRLALIAGLIGSRDVIVCSKKQYNAVIRVPGLQVKTHLIPVGATIAKTGVRSPHLPGAPLRLLYFGFVWRGRNIETCVRALHAVITAGVPATLTIAGGVRGDDYRREIVALAASLGVADAVTFTGDLPMRELSQTIADADLALLPFASGVSTGRSTFVVALEHGLPVVTMGSPDNLIGEFVPGENLLCVSPDDVGGFVLEVARLATDATLRSSIAANTPALAAYFAWDKIARAVAALPSYKAIDTAS